MIRSVSVLDAVDQKAFLAVDLNQLFAFAVVFVTSDDGRNEGKLLNTPLVIFLTIGDK